MAAVDPATALERARKVFERRPGLGLSDDAPATARWSGGTRIVASHHSGTQMLTDMPQELGGSGGQVSSGWMFRAGLPPLLRVNVRGSNAGDWLEASVRYALANARSQWPGGAGALAKLAEVLIVEVLRLYMNENSEGHTGWLVALSDRIVGAALTALHERPAQAWTLKELARAAGASRSVLAERFQQMVGSSPIQYLTQWRMTLAADLLLCCGNLPLAQVAEQVGYQTDTAFSRAFRRQFGAQPSAWRRRQAQRDAAGPVG